MFDTTWQGLKKIAEQKNLTMQYADDGARYTVVIVDGSLSFYTIINKVENPLETSDQYDFEQNFEPQCNQKISADVVSYFEKNDKDLKITSDYCVLDENGEAFIEIPVQGVMANGDGRFIDEGVAFFEPACVGDWITNVEVVDKDNVVGYGQNTVLKCYHDDEADERHQGWRIPFKRGVIEIDTLAGYGFLPAQLYLRIKGKRSLENKNVAGTMFCNIKWGKLG